MNERVLVTGGSGGIGFAIVRSLIGDGIACTVVDRRSPITPWGGAVDFEYCDLGNLDEVDDLCHRLIASGNLFNGVVHCAGVGQMQPLSEEPRSDWLRLLAVNLIAPIALTQGSLPLIQDGGSIVLIGSGVILKGTAGTTVYAASKAGLVGFARSLASELGNRQITVNTVSPGLTATPMMPDGIEASHIANRALKRREEPEDLVGAVRFFLSSASGFCTGQMLVVDGGSGRH